MLKSTSIVVKYCCQPLTVPCRFRKFWMLKESEHILKEALGTITKLYGKDSVEMCKAIYDINGFN